MPILEKIKNDIDSYISFSRSRKAYLSSSVALVPLKMATHFINSFTLEHIYSKIKKRPTAEAFLS